MSGSAVNPAAMVRSSYTILKLDGSSSLGPVHFPANHAPRRSPSEEQYHAPGGPNCPTPLTLAFLPSASVHIIVFHKYKPTVSACCSKQPRHEEFPFCKNDCHSSSSSSGCPAKVVPPLNRGHSFHSEQRAFLSSETERNESSC